MKFFVLILVFLVSNITNAQNYSWITPNTPYLKMYVVDDGMYRINKIDFTNSGINAGQIDPRTIKLYNKGVQIPIYFFGEQDGIFNDSDYFDFYGKRNYGGLTNTYQEANNTTILAYVTDEYFNLYSDTNVYWVGWGGSFGLRYNNYDTQSIIPFPQNFFSEKIQFEKDSVYSPGERLNNNDFRNFNTEKVMGEGWYWREMSKNGILSDTFSTPSLYSSGQLCSLKIFAYPNSYSTAYTYEHNLVIKINSVLLDTISTNHYDKIDTMLTFPAAMLQSGSVNQISITYVNPFLFSGKMLFDYFTLYYPKKFDFLDNSINFNTSSTDTSSRIFKVKYFNPSLDLNIYDSKNFVKITSHQQSSDTLIFSGKYNGDYHIVNNYIVKKPFRIKQKQVPDLLASSNGADYLLVYNKLFENQAEQLRAFHQSYDTLRSRKVEIEDIYDIFNFGLENPVAVKNLIKYVSLNWQLPKLKFVCLFGRGSLDPKNNTNSPYYQNLIPVYGNPPADGYFVNFTEGGFVYYPQVAIGRIPVINSSEASDVVNKIISYENQQLDKWVKQAVFITGGQTISEQIQFANQSDYFINQYILPPPLSLYPTKIYRNDSIGYVTLNYQDSIKRSIDRGCLIVNYIGHAANNTWENGIEDPDILTNGNRLPLVFSMTCFTGKNAEPNFRSFGEKFFYLPNKGAIGFVGTTGWSFSGSGNILNGYLIQGIKNDSLRRIGNIMKYALGLLVSDSSSFSSKNTINCYNLIGDPASKLILPTYPEFDIQLSDYKLSNPYPSLRENIVLQIFPKNLGTFADSCKIRYQLIKNNQNFKTRDTIIYNFNFIDTVLHNFSIDSSGNYTMIIILDPDNWYPQDIKTNNQISFALILKNISFVPLKPVDNIVLNYDSVNFIGLNPNIPLSGNNLRLIIQLDTSLSFNSNLLRTFFKDNFSGVTTNFKINIPLIDSNIIYFWRMNSIINGDSSGWSELRRFSVNLNSASYKIGLKSIITNDSIVRISKKKISQFNSSDFFNLKFDSSGINLLKFNGNLFAQSWGGDVWEPTYFIINGNEYYFTDSTKWGGLNIAKIRKLDGKVIDIKHFAFRTSYTSDSLLNYLNTFDTSLILMAVKNIPINVTSNLNSAVRNKFKQFGSTKIDSVQLNNYSRWSFISYNSQQFQLTSESYMFPNWVPVTSNIQPIFTKISGSIENIIGPVKNYGNFFLDAVLFPFSKISYYIYGISGNEQNVLLNSGDWNGQSVILDTINSAMYPSVKIVTNLIIDTSSGSISPIIKSFNSQYQPPCEIIPDNNSFIRSDSIVQEGDSITFRLNCYNAGYSTAKIIICNWSASSPSGIILLKSDTNNIYLNPGKYFTPQIKFKTEGLRNRQKQKDTVYVYFESKLNQSENEFYTYNNNAVSKFIITGDTIKPVLEVTYDGTKLQSGDYVQSRPEIIAKFLDNSQTFIKDTSNIKVKLDNIYVPYFINGVKNPDIDFISYNKNNYLQATVIFKPKLNEGEHQFEYISYDNSGNKADTVRNILTVQNDLKIFDLTNYPNPMKSETSFIFKLSGSLPPSKSKIKIYTVAGRLIKEILFNAVIGFNNIEWDGRDSDGDYIANGVYLYKLFIEGDNKKESSAQKLVILK
ncbi:MAG TPA: C25 family cysteine peptidase [Ignavibacteria bacterium]